MTSYIRLRVKEAPGARDERGRFLSAQTVSLDRNRRTAEILRFEAASGIASRLRRPGESSGRLERVTADPKNSSFDVSGVGVGNADFLDRSSAKYWRTFEQGSAATWRRPFVGTQLAPSVRGRTSANLITATGGRKGFGTGAYIVKREIAPANVYRDLAESGIVQAELLQTARAYFTALLGSPGG